MDKIEITLEYKPSRGLKQNFIARHVARKMFGLVGMAAITMSEKPICALRAESNGIGRTSRIKKAMSTIGGG
jgi:hypothetical protein